MEEGFAMAGGLTTAIDTVKPLDIRTKTIELTLNPMFQQITLLINNERGSAPVANGHLNTSLDEVIHTVQSAIDQFVQAGVRLGQKYPNIDPQMSQICPQAIKAGEDLIAQVRSGNKGTLISPIRQLLVTMYKILILADSVIIDEICATKDKVVAKLDGLTKVTQFAEFLNSFASFGSEMAEFGKLTGDRQLDTKLEIHAAKMACLRGFLEKSTTLYLTSCKVCLRHPTTTLSKDIRDSIVSLMQKGLDEIVDIVRFSPSADAQNREQILSKSLEQYMSALEMCLVLVNDSASVSSAMQSFRMVDEDVHEFTDSAYTPHERRELIILSCQKCQEELNNLSQLSPGCGGEVLETRVDSCLVAARTLKRQLIQHTVSSAALLFGSSIDTGLLVALRTAAQEGEVESVENISSQIRDHVDQIQEVCKQMQHVAPCDTYYIRVKYTASYLLSLTELLLQSAEVFCCHAMSKTAAEGYTAMADAWVVLIGELAATAEELQESLFERS